MTLLAQLVAISDRVGTTASRLGKVRTLADYLRQLPPDEVVLGAHYLSGETPQGRSGIGYALLQQAAGSGPAPQPALTLTGTNLELTALAALKGRGSADQRLRGSAGAVCPRDRGRAALPDGIAGR